MDPNNQTNKQTYRQENIQHRWEARSNCTRKKFPREETNISVLYCMVTPAEVHYTTMSKAATPNEETFDTLVGLKCSLSGRNWPVAYLQPIACNQMHRLLKRNM